MQIQLKTIMSLTIVLILIGVGFVFYNKNHIRKEAALTPIFQPEAQMLSQAQNAWQSVSSTTTDLYKKSSDHPETASTTTLPYSYMVNVCTGAKQSFTCFSDYYQNLVSKYGASFAFTDLKERYEKNPYVQTQCHPITHVIGQEASKSYKTVSEAYLHGDSVCWSGYYHGVMEGFVDRIGQANLPKKLDTICADIPGKKTYNFDYYNCVHGLGHGIMELLDDNVFTSLSMCDNLTGNWEQQSCYSGVYMENIIANDNLRGTGYVSPYLKPSEPLYPCTAVEDKYKSQCYLGQTSYALQVSGYDFKKVTDLCTTVDGPYRDICFQSIGRDAANQARHESTLTTKTCALSSSPNDVQNCMIGAVKEIISYYHSDTQAYAYCGVQIPDNKAMCMSTADSYFKNL